METTGRIKAVTKDWQTDKLNISFEIDTLPGDLEGLSGGDTLDITAKRHRNKRSLNANALLWKCVSDIAKAISADKWEVYLKMLRQYGEYTYVLVKPQAVEMLKRQWRECEEIGSVIDVHGKPAVQMLCYYGSSTYDTKQFSVLLDGVIAEMKTLGIETPTSEQMKRSLEAWEKMNGQGKTDQQ